MPSLLLRKKEYMKRIIVLLIIWCVVFQLALLEGYRSTEQMEEKERFGGGAERNAAETSREEEIEREKLYNPKNTEWAEEQERHRVLDNTQITAAQERKERSGLLNDARLTTQEEVRERKRSVGNAQLTGQEEAKERYPSKDNASLTERMEKEAHQDSH